MSTQKFDRQRALDLMILASGDDGMSPLKSIASSAQAYLSDNGFGYAQAGNMLRALSSQGGPLGFVKGSSARRILRTTLAPVQTGQSIEQQITAAKRRLEGRVAFDDGDATPLADLREVSRLALDNQGLLEENRRLTEELDRRVSPDEGLQRQLLWEKNAREEAERLLGIEQVNHRALIEKSSKYEQAMREATATIEGLKEDKSANAKLEYDFKKQTKEVSKLKREVSDLKTSVIAAEREAAASNSKARRLSLQLEEHTSCVSQAALAESRDALQVLQRTIGAESDTSLHIVS